MAEENTKISLIPEKLTWNLARRFTFTDFKVFTPFSYYETPWSYVTYFTIQLLKSVFNLRMLRYYNCFGGF